MSYQIQPIGVVHSCFKEKFGVPRQSGLAREASGVIELFSDYARSEAVRGLERFSHIWLLFIFHHVMDQGWRPTVRPPRLGGNQRLGVFATRSPFRPNHIGLSAVSLERIEVSSSGILLHVGGIDLVEGTPIIDIKPYLSYADSIPNSTDGFADAPPEAKLNVTFSEEAGALCEQYESQYPRLRRLIGELLALDPRPAYSNENERKYAMNLYDLDVVWCVVGQNVLVTNINKRKR